MSHRALGKQFNVPTMWGDKDIDPRDIDHPETQQAYLTGQCHALAYALHDKGHRIGAVVDNNGDDQYMANHYFAYDHDSPQHGIDIKGRRHLQDIVRDFGGRSQVEVHIGTIGELVDNQDLLQPRMTPARIAANKVLKRAKTQPALPPTRRQK